MEPVNLLSSVIRTANVANAKKPEDYQENGLLYCGSCHTPKQCRKNILGRDMVVGCMCACAQQKYDQESKSPKQQEESDRIMRLQSAGIKSQRFRDASFAVDDRRSPDQMDMLRKYAEEWEDMQSGNYGLLLYGDTETGKSYGAACVANKLIERFVPVCMINLSSVLNELDRNGVDKNTYIENLMQYPLLILDDFGTERQTGYAMEQVFNVIDARYRSKKPLIITTNLSWAELDSPKSLAHKRIYRRIKEMCQPLNFGSNDRIADIANGKMKALAELLRGD